MGTHYDTLGVRSDADHASVRAAYLAKARAHHPDRHLDDPPAARARSARLMREANAAWAVLADPVSRRAYDRTLTPPAASPPQGSRPAPPQGAPRPARPAAARPSAARPSAARPSEPTVHGDHDLVGRGIRLLPTAVVLALLLGIFVFTAFAANTATDAPTVTVAPGDLAVGACVRTARVITTVPCQEPHDATVASIVDLARGCPSGTAVYTLDRSRVACLRPVP